MTALHARFLANSAIANFGSRNSLDNLVFACLRGLFIVIIAATIIIAVTATTAVTLFEVDLLRLALQVLMI